MSPHLLRGAKKCEKVALKALLLSSFIALHATQNAIKCSAALTHKYNAYIYIYIYISDYNQYVNNMVFENFID